MKDKPEPTGDPQTVTPPKPPSGSKIVMKDYSQGLPLDKDGNIEGAKTYDTPIVPGISMPAPDRDWETV